MKVKGFTQNIRESEYWKEPWFVVRVLSYWYYIFFWIENDIFAPFWNFTQNNLLWWSHALRYKYVNLHHPSHPWYVEQQVGVWCDVWQDYHKHGGSSIGFQPINRPPRSLQHFWNFHHLSSDQWHRTEVEWYYRFKCWINDPDYRKIEAGTVYIALFPIHRIQISVVGLQTKLFPTFDSKAKEAFVSFH